MYTVASKITQLTRKTVFPMLGSKRYQLANFFRNPFDMEEYSAVTEKDRAIFCRWAFPLIMTDLSCIKQGI